jgi:hypothetical protein
MPHIDLNSAEPGIRGLLQYRPETARPLSELTEVLLRGPSTLTLEPYFGCVRFEWLWGGNRIRSTSCLCGPGSVSCVAVAC